MVRGGAVVLVAGTLIGGLAAAVQQSRVQHQRQTDPEVATVWLIGTTFGPNHTLVRGSEVQRWANMHGIHALGDYTVLSSSFNGDSGGVEFWFDYDSHTSVKELECHRVGPTAFTDDLGQVYHGFLDFQGKAVGVYLPGYDPSAHRLACTVRWMPRRPAAPFPVSHPMTFTVPLPAAKRLLPPAASLPAGPLTVTQNSVTVTVSAVHLSPPRLRNLYEGQRDLTFHLEIRGGQIADDNVEMPTSSLNSAETLAIQRQIQRVQGQVFRITAGPGGGTVRFHTPSAIPGDGFTITDPYGTALLHSTGFVTMPSLAHTGSKGKSADWIAPVNGAGRGTDCVNLHFHVTPLSPTPKTFPLAPLTFNLLVPVTQDRTPVASLPEGKIPPPTPNSGGAGIFMR